MVSGSNTTSLVYINGEDSILENLEIHGGYWAIEVYDRGTLITGSSIVGQTSVGIKVKAQGINTDYKFGFTFRSWLRYLRRLRHNININNNTIHNNTNSGMGSKVMTTIRDNV